MLIPGQRKNQTYVSVYHSTGLENWSSSTREL